MRSLSFHFLYFLMFQWLNCRFSNFISNRWLIFNALHKIALPQNQLFQNAKYSVADAMKIAKYKQEKNAFFQKFFLTKTTLQKKRFKNSIGSFQDVCHQCPYKLGSRYFKHNSSHLRDEYFRCNITVAFILRVWQNALICLVTADK